MNLIHSKVNVLPPENEFNHLTFKDFVIYHNNEPSARQTFQEIFGDGGYYFETKCKNPTIIDGGANVGMATLFFKMHYPAAKITCFEPDPYVFALLKKNVAYNKLEDVFLINAALSNVEGSIDFYGQIHPENDARGNSILEKWGAQRAHFDKIQVNSQKLSDYITAKVDFLKLDIEGAEERVLTEIKNKLHFVERIHLEFHETHLIHTENNLNRVKMLLSDHGFELEVVPRSTSVFPSPIKNWVQTASPHLYAINAIKR